MLASIIPMEVFAGQSQWVLLPVAVVSLLVLMKGADWMVEGAAGVAAKAGMPKIVVGATIVSLGTTSSETAVSVLAAFNGNAGLALGNGVGSVIADTALIFGLGACWVALPADRFLLARQGWVQFGVAALLAGWCYGKWWLVGDAVELSLPIGLVLLAVLAWYLWASVRWARGHAEHEGPSTPRHPPGHSPAASEDASEAAEALEEVHIDPTRPWGWLIFWGLLGLALVIGSGEVLVGSASELALQWGVPQVVLAATLVAIGTSLPELVVGITSIRKGHPELLVGNVIGADILNVLWVIGLSAIGGAVAGVGLPVVEDGNRIFLVLHLPVMIGTLALFRLYIVRAGRRGHFERWMGVPMVLIYVGYVAANYLLA